jgi:O-antigen/teichoic acid export membrane protein
MTENQKLTSIRNISLYILAGLVLLALILYFTLSFEISIAIIISSFIAFMVFVSTLIFYRWVFRRGSMKAARFVILSFVLKIIFLGGIFYLVFWLDFVNIMAFIISFVVFFAIFLNIETFLIKKKLLFK